MTDLDALADTMDDVASDLDVVSDGFDGEDRQWHAARADSLRTAARILRAVAAAPGPLREAGGWELHSFWDWFDALADAVGEQ